MKLILLVITAILIFVKANQNDHEWIRYKREFSKDYHTNLEEDERYEIFKENDRIIKAHNKKYSNNEVTYKMEHNEFSVMTESEISKRITTILSFYKYNSSYDEPIKAAFTLPYDLSYKHHCLPPLNQGKCGSSWAFAATAQVEALLSLIRSPIEYLSPQHIIDCSRGGNCNGGDPFTAVRFMINNYGIFLKNYPYEAEKNFCWPWKSWFKEEQLNMDRVRIMQFNGNEERLKWHLAYYGPLVVAIHATESFFLYGGGVYSDNNCDRYCNELNHAVLLVGYGRDDSLNIDYWLVKNSYGTDWGENGYVRIIRNHFYSNCNIACYSVVTEVYRLDELFSKPAV